MTLKNGRNTSLWEAFSCHRCGNCCGQLPYDKFALPDIAAHLGLTRDEVIERYYGRKSEDGKSLHLEIEKRSPCPFLKNDGGTKTCQIYPVRPSACQGFPFDTDFGQNGIDCLGAKEVYVKFRRAEA